jgi:hypothetical protein
MNTRIDVRAVLGEVRVPTLVLHRTGDLEAKVEEGRYLAQRIPGAQFVELAGVDHFVAIDPDQIVDRIEPFVAELGEPAAELSALATVVAVEPDRSSELSHGLFGDLRWTRDAVLGEVARRHSGEVVHVPGHCLLLIFDGATRAIRGALDLVARLAEVGLPGRVAVHSGPVDRSAATADGGAASLAERLVALAPPGEVLVTETTRSLVEGSDLDFDERPERLAGAPPLYVVR